MHTAQDPPLTRHLECAVDVNAPPALAYAHWCDLEALPDILRAVRRVQPIGPDHSLWEVDVGGHHMVWEAKTHLREPGKRVAWHSLRGTRSRGEVRFEPIPGGGTRICVALDYRPRGWVERLGAWLGLLDAQVRADLGDFRAFLERRADTADSAES